MGRKLIIKLIAALTVFAATFAFAASVGGISGNKLGADNVAVSSCDSDGVTTSYTSSYDSTDQREEISTVTVAGVADACDGQNLKVTLTDSAGASLGSGTLAIPTSVATSFGVTMSPAASAKLTSNVHVTIAQ